MSQEGALGITGLGLYVPGGGIAEVVFGSLGSVRLPIVETCF